MHIAGTSLSENWYKTDLLALIKASSPSCINAVVCRSYVIKTIKADVVSRLSSSDIPEESAQWGRAGRLGPRVHVSGITPYISGDTGCQSVNEFCHEWITTRNVQWGDKESFTRLSLFPLPWSTPQGSAWWSKHIPQWVKIEEGEPPFPHRKTWRTRRRIKPGTQGAAKPIWQRTRSVPSAWASCTLMSTVPSGWCHPNTIVSLSQRKLSPIEYAMRKEAQRHSALPAHRWPRRLCILSTKKQQPSWKQLQKTTLSSLNNKWAGWKGKREEKQIKGEEGGVSKKDVDPPTENKNQSILWGGGWDWEGEGARLKWDEWEGISRLARHTVCTYCFYQHYPRWLPADFPSALALPLTAAGVPSPRPNPSKNGNNGL